MGFQSQTAKQAGNKVWLLSTVLLALVAITLFLLPRDPMIAAKYQALIHPPKQQTGVLGLDPKQPTKEDKHLPFPILSAGAGKQIIDRARKTKKGLLLVYVGDCAGCIEINTPAWEKTSYSSGLPLVLLSNGTQKEIARFRSELHLRSPVIQDPQRQTAKAINATWVGRSYWIAPDGMVRWRTEDFHPDQNPYQDVLLVNTVAQYGKQP